MLERDPVKTAWDVENGFLTREAADQVFGIVLKDDEDGYPRRRSRSDGQSAAPPCARQRLAKAIPVSDWIAAERQRVEKADFAPEVKKMYASAIKLSPRFTKDFSDFWNVDAKSVFTPGGEAMTSYSKEVIARSGRRHSCPGRRPGAS